MKTTVNYNTFKQAFINAGRENTFSGDGLCALFDYLEDYENDTGEELELDVIALCCEYSEYASIAEIANDHWDLKEILNGNDIKELEEGLLKAKAEANESDECQDVIESLESELESLKSEAKESAIEWLRDRTQVIVFDDGIIIQQF